MIFPPKFLVFENFLAAELHARLLDFALANEPAFEPARVVGRGTSRVDPEIRIACECNIGLGPNEAAFNQAIHARQGDILLGLGMAPFQLKSTELQLVAHGNGARYEPHIDTLVGASAENRKSVRVVSCVYYFHREPKRFSGGELTIYSFGTGAKTEVIEPRQNRLVAFPAFGRHEVQTISCPSGQFADSRFAINCWLRKAGQLA